MASRTIPTLSYGLLMLQGLAWAQQGSFDPGLPIPHISDNSLATQEVVKFFNAYYTAKSSHNISSYMDFFYPVEASYTDVTLGSEFATRSAIQEGFTGVFSNMGPGSIAYPLQIIGDTRSAIVASVDTPGMYGAGLRLLTVFDFLDNKITRVLDVCDGRQNIVAGNRITPVYYNDLGLATLHDDVDPKMDQVAQKLNSFLATGNFNATRALFSYDAVFEDHSLSTRLQGQLAIGRYLNRSISQLPYGTGTVFRHVVGKGQGGGYE